LAISKTKEKITLDNKNKISIITNIEVNINQNNSAKPNNTNNIINLNINSQRPTTIKKQAPTPYNLPISQISNHPSNSPNLILSTNPISLKANDLNKPRNLQSSQLFNDHRIVIRDTRKKDAETQTEEIFFKM
jgi:hypothetical protein